MVKKIFIFALLLLCVSSMGFTQKSPGEFLGVTIGADKTLVNYPDIIRYFQYIADESGRIRLTEEGKTTQGNPMFVAAISAEKNIQHLDQLIEINKKLTNADLTPKEEVPDLLKKAKVFVLITCTIHATEVASSQFAMQLAHHLATTKDETINGYLDDVVILLMPSINPDGNIMVTDWYNKYKGTEFEGCRLPYLYHHYAGHDNNRDFYMLNLAETRVVNAVLHHRYFPHVFLDMHQMGSTGPRMFVPPFKDPLNQNLDPLMIQETNVIGGFMALKLQEQDKKGVASSYAFDAYWPGGSKNTAWYKNVVGLLTELASARIASPIYVEPNELRVRSKGLPEYKAQVNFPDPWPGGWWRLEDIIQYESIAVNALIEITAKNRRSFLKNYYRLNESAINNGKKEAPYGYVIPVRQHDEPAVFTFVEKMTEHGVRVSRLMSDQVVDGHLFKEGDFVISLAQPYGHFVKVMMSIQHYPEIRYMQKGPVIEPYDAAGWTMPLQMGVKWFTLNSPLTDLPLEGVDSPGYPVSKVTGDGDYFVIPGAFNRSVIAVNRLLKKGIRVFRHKTGDSKEKISAGDFIVAATDLKGQSLTSFLEGTGVWAKRTGLADKDQLKPLRLPRLAIYQSYRASIDEGWTRWVLDHFEFPYKVLHNKDFLHKKFTSLYDVIIFPDQKRATIVDGSSTSWWARFGMNIPPEFKGGIGEKGMKAVIQLVKEGGSIILLDSASELAIKDFSLPLFNVLKDVKQDQFNCPGSLLKISIDNRDPLGWGMEKEGFIYFSGSPAFRTSLPQLQYVDRKVVASFGDNGSHLLSGYLKGGELLNRGVTTVRFDYHKGHVMVLGGRVQHRSQTFGTFKFLFNAILY